MNTKPDEHIFAQAIEVANIPTLLMVLVQLTTGTSLARRALFTQALPTSWATTALEGSLEHQREVRESALEAILAWREGRPVALPEPDEDLIVRMLSVSMAEPVPAEYGQFTAAQLGQVKFLDHEPVASPDDFSVLIIGAGVSGLCAAINLQMLGINFKWWNVTQQSAESGGESLSVQA